MNDYPPLHSPEALKKYHALYLSNQIDEIPPIPIIPYCIVRDYFARNGTRFEQYQHTLQEFIDTHPDAIYFKVDGTHRSTAGLLTKSKIPAYIVQTNEDVKRFRQAGVKGLGVDLEETLKEQEEHYFKHKIFWTLQEKALLMIRNGDIPAELIIK